MRLGQRAPEHREVLAEHEDEAAVDRAVAGDDAVAEDALVLEPESAAAVDDERVELDEGPRIEQQLEPLARGQLPFGVLLLDTFLTAAESRLRAQRVQSLDLRLVVGHAGLRSGVRRTPGRAPVNRSAARTARGRVDRYPQNSVDGAISVWITSRRSR